ncbi:hypothetical protein Q1695_014457 [Nippostrongylus brasiliensis]|nr:hypothetical protein Q1695_014457 [Nippostrongylus brasiliensis]
MARKNALLAQRHYIWVAAQLLLPVIVGAAVMTVTLIGTKVANSTATVIFHEKYKLPKRDCGRYDLQYVAAAKENDLLNDMLKSATASVRYKRYNNTDALYDGLAKEAPLRRDKMKKWGVKRAISRMWGLEVTDVNETLSFIIHSADVTEVEVSRRRLGTMSDAVYMDLRDNIEVVIDYGEWLFGCLHYIFMVTRDQSHPAYLSEDQLNFDDFIYMQAVSVNKSARHITPNSFEIAASVPLLLVVLMVAFCVSWDAKMKELMIIMNAGRLTFFVSTVISHSLLAIISITLVYVLAIVFSEGLPLGVIYVAYALLTIAAVIIGILCGTVLSSSINAVITAFILWCLLAYVGITAPQLTSSFWIVLINQLNVVAAFGNIIEGAQYQELRGIPLSFSTTFAYSDYVSPGMSILFMAFDIILYFAIVVIYDSIEWAGYFVEMATMFRKTNLEQLESQSERKSWHQFENVRPEPPDVDTDGVSKVDDASGALLVYRFEIRAYAGEVSVILGHSGCGKSTILKMICGSVEPTRGAVRVCNKNVFHFTSYCRSKLGYCPQDNLLYKALTVEDHLWLFYNIKRIDKAGTGKKAAGWKKEASVLCGCLELDEALQKQTSSLSQSEMRKLCVAIAFIGGSRVVLLDEPTNGMDYKSKNNLRDLILKHKENRAVLLTTESMEDAEEMGQQLYVMYNGRTICSGDIQFVKGSFGGGYMLHITMDEKDLDRTSKRLQDGITASVAGSKVRTKKGKEMEIELPKLQERLFPKMLKTLEEEKQAGYVRDFQLIYGNIEETFQKMGESIHASKNEITTPLGSDTWKCSQDRLCMYRSFFLIWKRALLTILHVPLLLSQIVVPLFLVLSTTEERIKSTPAIREKVSYASAPPGRFIVFNSNGDPLLANTMTRFISNYKHIKVEVINSSDIAADWPTDWPFVLGAMHITGLKRDTSNTGVVEYLFPKYLANSHLMMIHAIMSSYSNREDIFDTDMVLVSTGHTHERDKTAAFILNLALILLTSSFAIAPGEEVQSFFKRQQLMTGTPRRLYWLMMIIFDSFVAALVCLVMSFVLQLVYMSVSWAFRGLMLLYCVINLPLAYLLSCVLKSSAYAYLVLVIFQCVALVLTVTVHTAIQGVLSWFLFIFPSTLLASETLKEMEKKNFLDISRLATIIAFLVHGVVYLVILCLIELKIGRLIAKKLAGGGPEGSTKSLGNDVKSEQRRIEGDQKYYNALIVKNLIKHRGPNICLKNISFGVDKNTRFGLVGESGAGKTVLFDIVTGEDFPTSGQAILSGVSTQDLSRVGCSSQQDGLCYHLTCRQNIMIILALLGYSGIAELTKLLIETIGVKWCQHKLVAHCSKSQRRRISIGLALVTKSRIIALDEPTRGVDPATRRHIWQLITTTQLEERMIFFTSSTIEECEKISDRYGILHQGRLAAIGPVETMSMRHTKLYILELELVDKNSRGRVETAVQSAFPSAVKEATPEGKTEILRWRIPIDGKNRLSAMFERMKNVTSGLPVSNPTLSQCSYEIALTLAATELEAKPKGAPIDALSVMI